MCRGSGGSRRKKMKLEVRMEVCECQGAGGANEIEVAMEHL